MLPKDLIKIKKNNIFILFVFFVSSFIFSRNSSDSKDNFTIFPQKHNSLEAVETNSNDNLANSEEDCSVSEDEYMFIGCNGFF